MATDFDEEAFREVEAILNGDKALTKEAILSKLDDILLACAIAALPDEKAEGCIDVEPAWDYLDKLALHDGLLAQLVVHLRWPIAQQGAQRHDEQLETEAAALLGPVADEPTVQLPMTCPAPEAHAREAAGHEVTFWQKALGRQPKPDQNRSECAYCGKPLPRSHRRKP